MTMNADITRRTLLERMAAKVPYAGIFLAVSTAIMVTWFKLGLPFGF